jgi:hypothetical protein
MALNNSQVADYHRMVPFPAEESTAGMQPVAGLNMVSPCSGF